MSQVESWLLQAGLEKYVPTFAQANLSPVQFVQITIQDYATYGITALQDKQKLFRLITSLKSQAAEAPREDQRASQQRAVQERPVPEQRVLQRQPPQQLSNPVYPPQQNQAPPPPQQIIQQAQPPKGRANQFTANPTAHPNCPAQIDGRGIPTINKTVIPTDQQFLEMINQKIRVVVRKRPVNSYELQMNYRDIMSVDGWNQSSIHEPKVKVDLTKYIEVSSFKFDQVFAEQSDNYEVYFYTAKPLINAIFQGRFATCFAYGQTGSGKTWTMMQRETGIYVLAANDIFQMMHSDPTYSKLKLTAHVSFYEIYGGKLFDLLNERKILRALEDGKGVVQIFGISEQPIATVQELLQCIDAGLQARSVGATGANADSSRSHAILQIALKSPNQKVHGKISFIDLAGAERASDVQDTDRQTRMEGAEINKSLLALKECIRAMDKGSAHLPFRDSKLTLVLRDSFIKDSKTVMIACCSPTEHSCENTLNTLRYADRVKDLGAGGQNRTKIPVIKPSQNVADIILGNVDNDAEIAQQQYQAQMAAMKGGNQQQQREQVPSFQQQIVQIQQPMQQPMYQAPVQPVYQQVPVNIQQQFAQEQEVYVEQMRDDPGQMQMNELQKTHSKVVDQLYDLEDEITRAHRRQVDQMMASVKEEVALLHQIENQQISVDQWVNRLENILTNKESAINELRAQLVAFKFKLKEEQELSESWKHKK